MTLKRIEDHILDQAKAEASTMTEAARQEADRLTSAAREQCEAEYAAAVEGLQRQLKTTFEQETGKLRADCGMELLRLKTRILDDIFRKAARKLLERDDFWNLVQRQLKEVAGREGRVHCRADHRDAVGKLIDEINGASEQKIAPLAEEPVDITGGFVFRGAQFDIDYSLDSQLADFREKTLPELIARAFPEE